MENIILALAAITQSVQQVNKVAWKGQWDEVDVLPLIRSIFAIESESIVKLYSGSQSLATGLRALRAQLDPTATDRDPALGQYIANLFTIQKQFMRNSDIQNVLSARLEHAKRLLEFDDYLSSNVLSSLADCYSESISKLPLRIQVKGEPSMLDSKANQDKIRALLLAAVRAAVLWRQVGGRKRQFLFSRKAMVATINDLLKHPIN